MEKTFDNVDRNRYYGIRVGDIVKYNVSPLDKDEKEYKVVRYGFMDNNRVYLQDSEGNVLPAVAEWCVIVKKVEEIKGNQREISPN